MEDLDGSWSVSLQAAVANASWTEGAGRGLSRQTQLVLETVMVLMCLCAVTGNILVIIIVAATKTFHSVTSVLIMNLAISDLLVAVGVMPFVALSIMNRGWVECTDLCLYVGYTSSVYCTASVLTLAAIALDRYHSIVDCLLYSSRCTPWRTGCVVMWIWLQAVVTSCPPLLGWSSVSYVVPMFNCAVKWSSSPSYTAFMAALSYLIPAVVILFCYVNIVKVARGHARRIHTLEDSVQRARDPGAARCGSSSSSLIYHVSGRFVSEVSRDESTQAAAQRNDPSSRSSFSFLAHGASRPPPQSPHQNQHGHHGLVRLFLVIAAFFLCWTPYMAVALVQATETAISGRSRLVPHSAVTFSYWLVLLNSDINPLLYALLSKRFQGAFQRLAEKVRARLGRALGREVGVRAGGGGGSDGGPCTRTPTHLSVPPSSSESSSCDVSRRSSSVFTVSTGFQHHSGSGSFSVWQEAGGEGGADCLRVPPQPKEGGRLPFSALTEERQATFFYGQITVRVEHDVC
ncbi:5-hydroxytryptamine receptor 1F [Gasterosteus aculeatus]